MRKGRSIICVFLVLSVFNACAEDVAPTARATPVEPTPAGGGRDFREEFEDINPCKLLTAEEVGAALGQPVEAGERNKLICTWESSEEDGAALYTRVHGEGRNPRGICAAHVERGEQTKGIGLDAGYSEAEGLAIFTQGIDHACVIINTIPPGELNLSELKELGELVLARPPFSGEGDEEEEEEEEEEEREREEQQ